MAGQLGEARSQEFSVCRLDDEDGDDLCDMSISGLGDALRVELLDEVTHTAWCDAADRYLELAPRYWRITRARLDCEELDREVGWLTVPELPLPTMLPSDAIDAP